MSVIRMPDGALVRFPDDMPADQIRGMILKKFPDAAKKAAPEDEPKEGSVFDVPLQVAQGVSSGVRGITNIFGAENFASKGLRGLEGYLSELLSAQGKDDQTKISQIFKDAEDKGFGAQLGAAWDAFKTAPVSAVAQGLGTALPTIAGGVAGAATRLGVRGTGALIGAAMGTGMVKGSIYDAVNQQLLDAGVTEEQAAKAASQAQAYTGDNLGMIGTGGFLGAITGGTGIEPALAGVVTKGVAKSFAGRMALGAVAEGIPEVAQGGQERLAQNLALQNAGFDVPTMRGVVGAGAYEGLVGGVLGGGIGAISGDRSESGAVQEPVAMAQEEIDGLTQANQRPAGDVGDVGPELRVSPPSGKDVDAGVAAAVARTSGAGLEVPRGPAQQAGNREDNVPGSLDKIIAQEASARIIPRNVEFIQGESLENLQNRQYDLEQQRELTRKQENYGGEVLPAPAATEQVAPIEQPAAPLTFDTKATRKERTAQAVAAVKAVVEKDYVGIDVAQKDINQAAQRLVNSNGGDPSMSLARVLESEPAAPKKARAKAKVTEEVPFESVTAVTDALTPEAMDLLAKVDAGGVPGFMSKNLRKIAAENGVATTSNMTPKDVVNALRARGAAPKTEVAPETAAPTMSIMGISPRFRPAFTQGMSEASGAKPFTDQAAIGKKQPGWQAAYKAGWQSVRDQRRAERAEPTGTEAAEEVSFESAPATETAAPKVVGAEPTVTGAAPDLFSANANPKGKPYVRAEVAKNAVPPEMTNFPKTPQVQQKPVTKAQTQAEARAAAKVMADANARIKAADEAARKAKAANEKGRIFSSPDALLNADAALEARGPQGITAARAAEMSDPSYRPLLQRAEGETEAAAGMFSPLEKLIRVALDSGNKLKTLHHEAIHAMRSMGLFKDSEWAALSKRAKDEWIAKYDIKTKYAGDNLTEEQEIEEAVAEAYADYVANKNQGGKTKALFDRVRNFLRAVVDAVRGTPEGVFQRIEKGKVGRRERKPATGEAAQAPTYKGSSKYSPERNAERAQVETVLRKRLDELGLHDVALKVPDWMEVERGEVGGAKLQRAAGKQVEEAQTARDKVRASRTAEQTVAGVKDMFKSRSVKGASAIGRRAYKGMSPQSRRAWLWVLPTEDVLRNAKALVGDRIKNIDDLSAAFDGAEALRNKLNFAGQKISERLGKYQAKAEGSDFTNLEDVILGSTLEQVDLKAPMPKDASRSVKELYDVWKTLPTEARTLYEDIFDFFDKQKHEQLRLTLEDVQTSALPKELKEQITKEVKTQFEEILRIKRYFPLSRPGKYWLRFGNGADYQMRKFETAMARNAAQDQYVEKLKAAGDKRDIDTLFADEEISTGDDMHSLRVEIENRPDTVLNRINEIIKNASDKNAKEEIADSVFQLYMDSLAGTGATRHWAPRSGDDTVGFSTDINRVFSARAMAGANHLARLAYHNRISNLIGGMYEAARGRADSDTLMPFIDTMAARARRLTDPLTEDTIWDSLARNGNKVVWVFMLTAPRSGVMNVIQVPGVAMPVMAASIKMPDGSQLGYIRASAALTKNFGTVFLTLDGKGFPNFKTIKGRFATRKNAAAPRLGEALGKIYEQFEEEGRFSTTFMSTMNSIARGPSPKYAMDPWSQVGRGTKAVLNWITAFFQMTESRSRQLVAMTTAEIEYTNAIKSGKQHDAAVQIARNSALKIVGEGMFNYAGINRSELMTGGSGRGAGAASAKIATQFSSYITFFTSHIFRNAHTMFRGLDKAERKAAATKLFGTLGMVGMFGGVQGLGWLYGSIMAMLDALGLTLKDADDDDDDDDQSNPLLNRNSDAWFKEYFLPTYFGPGSGLAKTFGLDKKSADALVSSIYSGPISALTGADFSPSIRMELPFQRALPFDSIFFSDEIPDISDRNAFESAIFHIASGPAGGLITQWQSGLSDLFKGDFLRGAEQMVPAIARGPIRSLRFATEGSLTREGAEIKGKEGFTPGMLLKQSVGFSDTRLDELQRARFLINKAEKQIDADRNEVYFAFDRASRSGSESAFEKARKALRDFNAKNPRTPIFPQQITQSILSKGRGRASSVFGAQPSRRFRGLTADALSAYDDEEE